MPGRAANANRRTYPPVQLARGATVSRVARPIETGCEKLRATVDDTGVLRIVLDNPDSHNSLTADMMGGVEKLLGLASADRDIRAVLIRGAGNQAFASGADIGEHADRAKRGTPNPDRGGYLTRLQTCTKPVVAMIHGYCMGGGLMVAMAADIRIAADDAVFSVPAARLGVAYPLDAVHTLVDIVGRAWASELCLTARRINATLALEIGLATRVVPRADLDARTDELLATLTAGAPMSISVSKAAIAHASAASRPPVDSIEAQVDAVWRSEDATEGMKAFFEKRPPDFLGR